MSAAVVSPYISTRFLQLRDTAVATARCSFRDLPAAMRELQKKVLGADLAVAPPPVTPVDIHAEKLKQEQRKAAEEKDHPNNKNKNDDDSDSAFAKKASHVQPPTTLFAHLRWDELLQIGCALDRVPTSPVKAADNNVLRFSGFDPRSRCAHMSFQLIGGDDDPQHPAEAETVESVKHHALNGSVTGETGPSLEQAFARFVDLFRAEKQQTDPSLAEFSPSGEFFIMLPDSRDWASFEFFAVLATEPVPVPVVLDHDAGVDDLLALLLLASATVRPLRAQARRIQLIGTTIVDADCFGGAAGELCRRAMCLFHSVAPEMCNVPVGVSPLPGVAAPFPDDWRKDSITMLDLPCLYTKGVSRAVKQRPVEMDGDGHEVLARLVMSSPRPVTVIVTGPLTNVAYALIKYGAAFSSKVREISIMGGAVFVKGNVENRNIPAGHAQVDTSQEWNIYWDAPAAKAVIESPLLEGKILLYSTDATNHVPVTSEFVRRFGKITHELSARFASIPPTFSSASPSSPTTTGSPGAAVASPTSAASTRGSTFATLHIDKLMDDDEDEDDITGGDDPVTDTPTSLASFFGSSWATVTFLKRLFGELGQYCAWDVLAAAGAIVPPITKYALTRISVDDTRGGASEGRTMPVKEKGGLVRVGVAIDAATFYNLVLEATTVC